MESLTTLLVAAALGGLATRLCDLLAWSNTPRNQRPDIDRFYAIPFIIMPVLGSILVYIYLISDMQLNPLLAFNVGISAPVIVRSALGIPNNKSVDLKPGS